MAEVATIARPYAEAVFALADKAGALAAWSDALANLALVAQAPELAQLYGNPKVSGAQLAELFTAAGNMPAEAKGLIATLTENKRLQALPAIATQFEALKAEREGAVDAQITSAYALDGAELAALVLDLERRFKRKVRPHVTVDQGLIGGALIRVGDQVIDGSVRGKLEAMRNGLTGS
ncbi:MAG: F0F1 ATP synthase subunit delta [Burkholderiales bacterium]